MRANIAFRGLSNRTAPSYVRNMAIAPTTETTRDIWLFEIRPEQFDGGCVCVCCFVCGKSVKLFSARTSCRRGPSGEGS